MLKASNKLQYSKFTPGVAWFFITLLLMCTPGRDLPKVNWLEDIDFDKVVHIVSFGLLVVLFCWPFYKTGISSEKKVKYFFIIALSTCVWGYAVELMQKYLIEGRTYSIVDWIADSIGAIIAYYFCKKKFI